MATETIQITDHTPVPWSKLLNPFWLLANDDGFTAPVVNNGTLYLPSIQNQFLRNLLWWIRNPAANFVGYVIGLEGKNYSVTGSAPVIKNTGRDCEPQIFGWRWAVLDGKYPYVNYWNGHVEFYFGWRPTSGQFGLKLVFPSSPIQIIR